MVNISNLGILNLTRGDDCIFYGELRDGDNLDFVKYIADERDEIYFGIMEPNQPFENAIVRKKLSKKNIIEENILVLEINSLDTINLIPGAYYYQFKLNRYTDSGFKINTLNPKSLLYIEE